MTDEAIVALYFARDEAAISESDRKYGVYCTKIAMNILSDVSDSEECVNDTWLGAWRSIPPKSPANLAAYLGKITRNLSINRFQKRHADKRGINEFALSLNELDECIPGGQPAEPETDAEQIGASISAFLRTQKELERRIFVRRYFFCDAIADLAAQLDMSESRVKSLLFRMRARLRKHLEADGIFIDDAISPAEKGARR